MLVIPVDEDYVVYPDYLDCGLFTDISWTGR